jgi:hydrogenase maturation protein HypF
MAESGTEKMAALSIDGTGHGTDGNAWGGEVMFADLDRFDRLAHLQYIPLIGGEKALYDIRRLRFAIDLINGTDVDYVDDRTADVFAKAAKNSALTSSFGRFLDALAYSLGVCDVRSYDGEPAMKMEPLLARGKRVEGFETSVENGEIMTAHLFRDLSRYRKEDAAYSAVDTVIARMVETAADSASRHGIRKIGLTGGVSYSIPISQIFVKHVTEMGFEPVLHDRVPNGDGGISVGQAAIALKRLQ